MMVNKDARMVETMMNDIFGFCIVNARCKGVFFLSIYKWQKMKNGYKLLEKCFL